MRLNKADAAPGPGQPRNEGMESSPAKKNLGELLDGRLDRSWM